MVQAHNDSEGINCAHHERADAEAHGDQRLSAVKHPGLYGRENRANNGKGDKSGGKDGTQRRDEQINDLRHMLMQPLFNDTHQINRQNNGNHVPLIADLGHIEEK